MVSLIIELRTVGVKKERMMKNDIADNWGYTLNPVFCCTDCRLGFGMVFVDTPHPRNYSNPNEAFQKEALDEDLKNKGYR